MNQDSANSNDESPRDAAIEWWLRRKPGSLSRAEKAEFEAWLARSEANRAAFEDISEMCGHIVEMRPVQSARSSDQEKRRAWRLPTAALVAASFALFVVFDDLSLFLRSDYSAGTGQTKRVTLEDGSHVELDAKSAISVGYAPGVRRLTLLEGEAWFEVALDPTRPFVVEAAGGTVTALGTAFDVAVEKEQAQVTVTQHRVSIASGGQTVIVDEGQQSAYAKSAMAHPVDGGCFRRLGRARVAAVGGREPRAGKSGLARRDRRHDGSFTKDAGAGAENRVLRVQRGERSHAPLRRRSTRHATLGNRASAVLCIERVLRRAVGEGPFVIQRPR